MNEADIVRVLRKRNPDQFNSLRKTTVREWIDFEATPRPCWKQSVIDMAKKNNMQGGHSGRLGILVSSLKYTIRCLRLTLLHRRSTPK